MSKKYISNQLVSCGDEGDDGAVLFNPDTNDLIIINQTGQCVWEFLNTPHTLDEVVSFLDTQYQIAAEERTAEDVEAFIEVLMPDFVAEEE